MILDIKEPAIIAVEYYLYLGTGSYIFQVLLATGLTIISTFIGIFINKFRRRQKK